MKISWKTKKSTYFYLYCSAFEQLVCPHHGAFAGLFSKNPNVRGLALGLALGWGDGHCWK